MLLIVGLPVFFLEMLMGQYTGLSCTKIYSRLFPGIRGLGYSMLSIPIIQNFQYCVIFAYSLYYMFMGFRSELPWSYCVNDLEPDFATENCYSVEEAAKCTIDETFFAKKCMDSNVFCTSRTDDEYYYNPTYPGYCYPTSINLNTSDISSALLPFEEVEYRSSASEEFWYHYILRIEFNKGSLDTDVNSWSHWGNIRWEMVGCLALAWTLICLSLIKGVSSYGKVVYFTTLFPYVVLTISLGYVATLDGFLDGVNYYIVPKDWDKLTDINVWNDAAGQIFYSLSVGTGSQLLLASYNGFRNNCHRDALLVGVCNSLTSLYAGFTVFGVIGYIAKAKNADIADVVTEGPGLAFIVYPEALALMDVAPLFSFLFFFMLCLLAISSLCGSMEAIVAAIFDEFPSLKSKRPLVMVLSSLFCFLCGLSMCFDSGILMFTLLDKRTANAILIMAFVEMASISWFYGIGNVMKHIRTMGMEIPRFMYVFWITCWSVVSPVLIFIVTVLAWVNYVPDSYEDYEYPSAVQFMGWLIELESLFILGFVTLYVVWKRRKAGKPVAFIKPGPMMRPNRLWGPRADSGLPLHAWRENEGYAHDDDGDEPRSRM